MKSTTAPRFRTPFFLTTILFLILVGTAGQVPAGVDLEVPLEMVDLGLASQAGTGTDDFERAGVYLDPDWYDGASYYFEVVARNNNTLQSYDVFLRDPVAGVNRETITVTANTPNPTRFRTTTGWSPATGKTRYIIRVEQTASANQLVVYTARIIIQQTDATKTRIQIPLVQKGYAGSGGPADNLDNTTSVTYTQSISNSYSLWEKDTSVYADLAATNPWTLEGVLKSDNASGTAYAALFNATDNQQVTGAEISVTGTTMTLTDTSFSNTATNFDEGDEFEVRIKSNNSLYTTKLNGGARLYVTLTNLNKGEVLYRVGRRIAGTVGANMTPQRVKLDTSLFSNPAVYFEASGYCADNAQRIFLRDHGTNDSGSDGSDVSGSGINFNSGSKVIVRTSEITDNITSGNRFYTRIAASTNTLVLNHTWLVVNFSPYTHYAWWNSPTPTSPYITWNTAAHDIQDAIDVASPGATVIVRAGTYNENVTMTDGVDLLKESPGSAPAIVGDGTDDVVTFNGAFSTGCTLEGFDISGGGTYAGIYFYGTGAGIDNNTIVENCLVHGNSGPGIELDGSSAATTAPIIDNNEIYSNSQEGIYIIDAGSASEDAVIQNNTIRENTLAGINIGGDSYITIGDNNDIHSNYSGIAFDTGDPSTKPITIIGNNIYSNTTESGIVIKDAVSNTENITITQNDINQNDCGGIQIRNSCKLDITKNKIRDNVRGGVHTGTDVASGGGFSASMGDAILTIRQNKVYENGASNYGGGIDVRHASGTIENNLVYKSHRGGIRFGWEDESDPHITAIKNNTVVCPGEDGYGGGIIYDDLAGAVNDQPDGALPGQLVIRNNISAYNETAGLRVGNMPTGNTACPDNDDYDSGKYRDYNLLYSNNGTGATDCGWSTGSYIRSCVNQNYGGCGLTDTWPWEMVNPNDIMADPKFVNMGGDDYHLQNDSLAKNAGDDGEDMGAYGGTYPIHNLIDVDTDTGNTPAGGTYIMFDLGASFTITDVRLYGTNAYSARSWEVFVGSNTTNCTGTWGTSGGSWSVGGGTGWYPHTLSSSLTGRYIKLVSTGAVSVNEVFEFQYKETTNSYWRSPSVVEKDCTDING